MAIHRRQRKAPIETNRNRTSLCDAGHLSQEEFPQALILSCFHSLCPNHIAMSPFSNNPDHSSHFSIRCNDGSQCFFGFPTQKPGPHCCFEKEHHQINLTDVSQPSHCDPLHSHGDRESQRGRTDAGRSTSRQQKRLLPRLVSSLSRSRFGYGKRK